MELNAKQIKSDLEKWLKNFDGKVVDFCTLGNVLALINSQEQRIAELTEQRDRCELTILECESDIKRLTEDNERLKLADSIASVSVPEALRIINEYCESYIKRAEAKIVRKMQERLKEHLEKPEFPWDSFTVAEEVIDQIAKEMLEGDTNEC